MATHHNIIGELTKELLAVGDNVKATSISMTNVHSSASCTVDLYIAKKLTGKFYFLKNVVLPSGATLILEKGDLSFSNKANEFGLFIKLTGSSASAVDVIIN